jgi:outer membrane biosynthesis protein TonB
MTGDPIRLLDDPAAGALLRGDLATASTVQVQGLDHAAGLGALKAAVGAQTGAIPAVAVGGGAGSLAAKLLLGAAVIGGVAWWASSGDRSAMDPAIDPAPIEAPAATPEPEPEPEPEPGPRGLPAAAVPTPEPAVVPEEELAVPEPEPSATPPEPVSEPKSTRPVPRGEPRDEAAPPETLDDAVVLEARQIQAARRALATDADRALALTQSIATEFPRGQLVEERLAIAIRALAKLGRVEEARTKAEAFLEAYGRGAHATAVRRAVGLSD